MHTAELDSAVWCTLQSYLRNLGHLTSRCDAHRGAWLREGMHTGELDSAVCITPRSQTSLKMSVFIFTNSWRLSNTISWKTSEVKKIPQTICDFQYNFHSNILQYHRDSELWCTPWSLTRRYDAHRGIRLRGGMHTAKFFQILCLHDSAVWCTPQGKARGLQ